MPPWVTGVWSYPPRPKAQVRIGDAERDEALNTLADHFAAGRLTREEFDERSETAMRARYDSDLEPLFRDLPRGTRNAVVQRPQPPATRGPSAAVAVLVPLFVLAVVASIVLHGPILVGPLIWLLVLSGMGRRHRYR